MSKKGCDGIHYDYTTTEGCIGNLHRIPAITITPKLQTPGTCVSWSLGLGAGEGTGRSRRLPVRKWIRKLVIHKKNEERVDVNYI